MKFNIAYPATGLQKTIQIDEEKQVSAFYDKRMGQEIEGDVLGDEYKGYVFKISGGNDKQGFPMKQGVLCNHRVRLLLKGGPCYRPRRSGERRRKSIRGCIISHDIAIVALVVVKKGEKDVAGLTDSTKPRRLGPKRASKIRKLFALTKEDDVRKYVIRRELPSKKEGKKARTRAPKIQRLITPVVLQRRKKLQSIKRTRAKRTKEQAAAYAKLISQRREDRLKKSRSSKTASRLSRSSAGKK
eukprot:c18889_g1_i1.p1 GENE.c18889_g1_i1~~c18889_g1_i1.p1  ORF type:complete len:243 (+),score=51.49 c18889_g1_i1:67-795(+)